MSGEGGEESLSSLVESRWFNLSACGEYHLKSDHTSIVMMMVMMMVMMTTEGGGGWG